MGVSAGDSIEAGMEAEAGVDFAGAEEEVGMVVEAAWDTVVVGRTGIRTARRRVRGEGLEVVGGGLTIVVVGGHGTRILSPCLRGRGITTAIAMTVGMEVVVVGGARSGRMRVGVGMMRVAVGDGISMIAGRRGRVIIGEIMIR